MLLNLTPLDLLIMAEARMALYRLYALVQPTDSTGSYVLLSIRKIVSDHILDMRSDDTIPVYNFSSTYRVVIDVDYWSNNDPQFPEDALVWFNDGSRADSGTDAGIYGIRRNRSFSIPLGKYDSFFRLKFMPLNNVHM
jgi:hypothetical protein